MFYVLTGFTKYSEYPLNVLSTTNLHANRWFYVILSTRSPNLSFPVNYLSLFMTKANQHHLDLSYKVLKHIWQSLHLTLTFNGHLGINFSIMVDSSCVFPVTMHRIVTVNHILAFLFI